MQCETILRQKMNAQSYNFTKLNCFFENFGSEKLKKSISGSKASEEKLISKNSTKGRATL